MGQYLLEGDVAIRYSPVFREYGILVFDGGSSEIELRFCPWCGKRLPVSLRDKWFQVLHSLGYDPELFSENPKLSEEFRSDAWWKGKGL
jgi:hypothetical protein